jgi:hypothetical protein
MRGTVALTAVLTFLVAGCGGSTTTANTPATSAGITTTPQPSTQSRSVTTPLSPPPTSIQALCDAQTWPRPVPPVVGAILDDAASGSLACWDKLKAIAPDGHDAENNSTKDDLDATYRITAVSPPPGTPIGRSDWVTVHVVPVDLYATPPALHPCDWVTTKEAANLLGDTAATFPVGDESGSSEPFCNYSAGSYMVTSQLYLPGSFPVDAATTFSMRAAEGQGSDVDGLPGPARCTTAQRDAGPLRTLYVLLDGNRVYMADALNLSCDTLKQFAQAAIPRIGP